MAQTVYGDDPSKAQSTNYYNNQAVSPLKAFSYDARYRLLTATGREHIATTASTHQALPHLSNLPNQSIQNATRRYTQSYIYDKIGNILELDHKAPNNNWKRVYSYQNNATNQLASTTLGGITTNYSYDLRGNMVGLPHLQAMEWNETEELTAVQLNTNDRAYYRYSGGQRVRKVLEKSNKREERLYLGGVERYREYSSSGTVVLERWTLLVEGIAQFDTLTVDNGQAVVGAVPTIRYQYRDHLGSSTVEANEHGQVLSYEEYYPYGSSAYRASSSSADLSLKRYRFTDKEKDDETGLYYFGVRYYMPWLGRWTAADPGGFVDGINLYRYVRNNPVNGVDAVGYATQGPDDPPKYTKIQEYDNGDTVYRDNTHENAFKLIRSNGTEFYRDKNHQYYVKYEGEWISQPSDFMNEVGVGQILGGLTSGPGPRKGANSTSSSSSSSSASQATVIIPLLPPPPLPIPMEAPSSQIEPISTGSFLLDLLVGEIPYVGTGVDLANASIEYNNGNYVLAGLNAAAAIPLLGILFGSIAKSMKVARAIDKAVDATDLGKYGDDLNETITFYHGTTKQGAESFEKYGVDISKSLPDKDFGAGFYTSTNYDVAKRSPVGRVPGVNSVDDVHVIRFDIPKFELENLSSLRLKPNTEAFSDFTRFHKTYGPNNLQHGGQLYDMVTGPLVARINPQKRTVKHFENFYGISPSIQTSFHTPAAQRILNIYMRF